MKRTNNRQAGANVMKRRIVSMTTVVVAMVLFSTPLLGEEPGRSMGMKKMKDGMKMGHEMMSDDGHMAYNGKEITPNLKKHIAAMYEKMGACVKTEMSIVDCQKKVMKDCPVVAEVGYCPLMDGIAPMQGSAHQH